MKIVSSIILFLLTLFLSHVANGQTSANGYNLNDILKSYFYLFGQSTSIQYYIDQFPDNNEIVLIRMNESSYFGSARDRMRAYLISQIDEQEFLKQENNLKDVLSARYKNINLDVASLKTDINGRLKQMHSIPEDFKKVILSFKYQNNLNRLISDNYYYIFQSTNHSKSKGIDFNLKIPVVFESKEGDRPNVIQSFKSYIGNGFITFNILAQNAPGIGKPNKNDVLELISSGEYKSMLIPNAKNIKVSYIALEAFHGMKMRFDLESQRLDLTFKTETIQYMLFLENKMLLFTFGVESSNDFDEALFNAYVTSIMNTLVINSNYR